MDELLTIKQFAEKHPAFPQGTLRAFVFYAKKNSLPIFRKDVLRQVGGKVLLKEHAFFNWAETSTEVCAISKLHREYYKSNTLNN